MRKCGWVSGRVEGCVGVGRVGVHTPSPSLRMHVVEG